MRGKDFFNIKKLLVVGITPAHAGKSTKADGTPKKPQDHPRPCGEKQSLVYFAIL